ncbi:MAG: hypothetical protein ACOX2K_08625 [Bacillota bacterium]|jgi:metal-dependent amidase/aminoacylase/carboxypeptidase family protein
MDKDMLKRQVLAAIDKRRDEIIRLGEQIRVNPELGYKEHQTAALVERTYQQLGLSYRSASP